jgi:hypothetical protein
MNYQLDQNRAFNYQSYSFSPLPSVKRVKSNGQCIMWESCAFLMYFLLILPSSSSVLSLSLISFFHLSLRRTCSFTLNPMDSNSPNPSFSDLNPTKRLLHDTGVGCCVTEWVNLIKNSTRTSLNKAITRNSKKARITPRTLSVVGMDMMPVPIMLVDTLNTAPHTDACLSAGLCSDRSGTCSLAAVGDMSGMSSHFSG